MLVAVALVSISSRPADAGPHCWNVVGYSPPDAATLPVSPTIAYGVYDYWYGGLRYKSGSISLPTLRATIDGKSVPLTWRNVAVDGGFVRLFKVGSTATGKLELWEKPRFSDDGTLEVRATYTIVKEWSAGGPTLTVVPGKDNGLGPYRWQGDYADLQVDVPALTFSVRWRATARDAWRTLLLPAHTKDKQTSAWLGEETCGMRENIPLATLAKGIEIEVRTLLPDGREIAVTKGPTPLVFKPVNPAPKPPRAQKPPPPGG